MSDQDIGTLYVLANRDNSLAKIGLTRNGKPDTRADDYAREHGIQWRVFWSALTQNVTEAEARAHRDLADFRFAMVPGAREIFHVTPVKAQRVAARHVVVPKTAAQLVYEQREREREQAERERRNREAEAAEIAARAQREAAQKAAAASAAREEWGRKVYWDEYRKALLPTLIIAFIAGGAYAGILQIAFGNNMSGSGIALTVGLVTPLIAVPRVTHWLATRRQQTRIALPPVP